MVFPQSMVRLKHSWQKSCVSLSIILCLGLLGCAPSSPSADTQGTLSENDTVPEVASPDASSEGNNPLLATQGQMLPITAEVDLGDQTIGLEVARTRQEQSIGLMHRDMLADDRGMLFPFSPPEAVRFWMKNVLISLDMVFVYEESIVAIAHEVPPCEADPCPTYGPDRPQLVEYVIELRGGRAEDLGLQIGDPVAIEWLNPR